MSRLLIRLLKISHLRGETMAVIMRQERRRAGPAMLWWAASVVCLIVPADADAVDLIAQWPLTVNAHDRVGSLPAAVHGGVTFAPVAGRPAADFNGRDGYLEVADGPALALGQSDFSIALWINLRRLLAGIPGDLINKWDASWRR